MNAPQPVRPLREGFQPEQQQPAAAAAPEPAPAPAAEPAAVDDGPAVDTWPVTVKLRHRPIRNAKQEELHALVFREPTGGDINRYGNPVRLNGDGIWVIEEQKMSMMMAALSGVLLPVLETMDTRDWNSCAYRLKGFFQPEWQAWE